jgi:serine/threonine protein kinase
VGTDRWGRIQELYHTVLALEPSERAGFLSQACSNEPELRREVESLLAYEGQADGLLESPVWKDVGTGETATPASPPLAGGSQLGAFRIVERVGSGGMGEVYRATDTRLHRDVAIKMLPAEYAHQPQWLARFQREARAISALNHANICTLYDVGPNYLVMELVEGATLAGPVPIDTAIGYARQIAAGLEAAHEKGIIHRDLKPANIKVTGPASGYPGTVKILDFGLAKAAEAPASAASPTTLPAVTEKGMILGTAAYMSPEQARGQPVDRRTDIWAFGVILYELLTGKMLFGDGNSASDSLAAVLTREPDFHALPSNTPPRVRRLLQLCLRKDPKLRLQAIGDARILLDEPEPASPVPSAPVRRWIPWSVAAVLAMALLASLGAWLLPKTSAPDPGAARFLLPLPPGTSSQPHIMSTHAVPSPDGRFLVIVIRDTSSGKPGLWVRPLDSDSARRLDKTEGATLPFWSPDSRYLGFFAEGKLKRVAVAGGSVQTICQAPRETDGGTWNQEGVIVFAYYGPGAPLMRVSAAGGVPKPVTALEKDEMWHSWPQFLPDGRHLLYFAVDKEAANGAIYVQELGSTRRVLVMKNSTRGVWALPGYLLFVREGTLFAQRMDAKTFQLEGEPLAVAQDVAFNDRNGRNAVAVSRNGVLVYRGSTSGRVRQLTWYDRGGRPLGAAGKPGEFLNPSLSPDEKSVAVPVGPSGRIDIWIMDLASGVLTRMTHDSRVSVVATPVWSPDSQRLAVTQVTEGIEVVDVASGKVTPLAKAPLSVWDWSPDGSSILCTDGTRLSQLLLAGGAGLRTILDTPYGNGSFRFSPDGQYVVYVSNESGQNEIYVASFPAFAAKRKISSSGGSYPVWAKGGKEILYRAADGALTSAEIRTGSNLVAGTPRLLFKPAGSDLGPFGVTADGKRFLISEPVQKNEGEKSDITVVLNWTAGIR